MNKVISKASRAHTLCDPNKVELNIYGKAKAFSNVIEFSSKHRIKYADFDEDETSTSLAKALAKCTLLTGPLYIGQAVEQTFCERFEQHHKKYLSVKQCFGLNAAQDTIDTFAPGGELAHKLIRRNIEFRDLAYLCVELDEEELVVCDYLEKLLQAVANPPLSEFH